MNPNDAATNDATRDTTDDNLSRQGVTLPVAAKRLGVSLRTVQRRLDKGEIAFVERDGKRFVLLEPDATQSATVDATPRQNDATSANVSSNREAELKDEIRFLRGVVEQLQRDAIELRAIARDALKVQPRQLESSSTNGVMGSAKTAQNRTDSSEVGNYVPGDSNPPKTAQNGAQTSFSSYADINAWLESIETKKEPTSKEIDS